MPDPIALTVGDLHYADLTYMGAFTVPTQGVDAEWFVNGGSSITYSPATSAGDSLNSYDDPGALYPGSLWIDSEDTDHSPNRVGFLGQVSIPAPSLQSDYHGLPVATQLVQPLSFAGTRYGQTHCDGTNNCCNQDALGDCFWLPAISPQITGHLYGSVYKYYCSAPKDYETLMSIEETMNPATRSNFWHVGPHHTPDFASDWDPMRHANYIFLVPKWWSYYYAGGKQLAMGEGEREGGYRTTCPGPSAPPQPLDASSRRGGNMGPGFAIFDPADLASNPDSAYEFLGTQAASYTVNIPAFPPQSLARFSNEDRWMDAAWVANKGFYWCDNSNEHGTGQWCSENPANLQQAVVFLVLECQHDTWYRQSPPTDCTTAPDACGITNTGGNECGQQGDSGACWDLKLWFVRPTEYVYTTGGKANLYAPTAYESHSLTRADGTTPVFFWPYCGHAPIRNSDGPHAGVAYDTIHGILYVAEDQANNYGCCIWMPIIHVFKVNNFHA